MKMREKQIRGIVRQQIVHAIESDLGYSESPMKEAFEEANDEAEIQVM